MRCWFRLREGVLQEEKKTKSRKKKKTKKKQKDKTQREEKVQVEYPSQVIASLRCLAQKLQN